MDTCSSESTNINCNPHINKANPTKFGEQSVSADFLLFVGASFWDEDFVAYSKHCALGRSDLMEIVDDPSPGLSISTRSSSISGTIRIFR